MAGVAGVRQLGPCTRVRLPPPGRLSVQKVLPTLTSKSIEIYLSMAGAKQLSDTGFILVPDGALRPAVVCSRHCIALHRGACKGGYKRSGREGRASRSQRCIGLRQVPISW
jgi:hypothetical protein